jgi:hypothetical protein
VRLAGRVVEGAEWVRGLSGLGVGSVGFWEACNWAESIVCWCCVRCADSRVGVARSTESSAMKWSIGQVASSSMGAGDGSALWDEWILAWEGTARFAL